MYMYMREKRFYQTLQLFSLVNKSTNRTQCTRYSDGEEREGEGKFPSLTFPPLQGIFSKEIFLVASKRD